MAPRPIPLDPPFDENAAPSLLGVVIGVETWPDVAGCGDRARAEGVLLTECCGWTRVGVEAEVDVSVELDAAPAEFDVAVEVDVDACPAFG